MTEARVTMADVEHTRDGAEQLLDIAGQLWAAGDDAGMSSCWWALADWDTAKWPGEARVAEVSDDRLVIDLTFPWPIALALFDRVSDRYPALTVTAEWEDAEAYHCAQRASRLKG